MCKPIWDPSLAKWFEGLVSTTFECWSNLYWLNPSFEICKRESIKRFTWTQNRGHKSIEHLVTFICKHYKIQWKQLTNVLIAKRTHWILALKLKAFVAYNRLTIENCTQSRIFFRFVRFVPKASTQLKCAIRQNVLKSETFLRLYKSITDYGFSVSLFFIIRLLENKTVLLLGTFFTLHLCWTCLWLDTGIQKTTFCLGTCSNDNCAKELF